MSHVFYVPTILFYKKIEAIELISILLFVLERGPSFHRPSRKEEWVIFVKDSILN